MKLKALFFMVLTALFVPTLVLAAPEVHATGVGNLDFRPLLQEFLFTAFSVLSLVAIWALRRVGEFLKTKTGVNVLSSEKLLREYLDAAMMNALKYASTQVDKAEWAKVEVKNEMVAIAATYVMNSVPDALKYFGLTRESVMEKLLARFPDLEASLSAGTTVVVNTAPATAPKAPSRTAAK